MNRIVRVQRSHRGRKSARRPTVEQATIRARRVISTVALAIAAVGLPAPTAALSSQAAVPSFCAPTVHSLGLPPGALGGSAEGIGDDFAWGVTFDEFGEHATTWKITAFGVDVRLVPLGAYRGDSFAANVDRYGNVAVQLFPDQGPPSAVVVRPDHSRVTLRGATASQPNVGVSDHGGSSRSGRLAGVRDNAAGTSLIALRWDRPTAAPVVLPPLPGDVGSYAKDVADDGTTVGGSVPVDGGALHAVRWDPRGHVHALQMPAVDPGDGQGNAISVNGNRSTGLVGPQPARRFAIWDRRGTLTTLAPLPGDDAAVGYGVTPDGTAFVGESDDRGTTGIEHAVYTAGEALRPLPPLGSGPRDRISRAILIDSHDRAVGYSQPTPRSDIQPTLWTCASNFPPATPAPAAHRSADPASLPAASQRALTMLERTRAVASSGS